MGRRALPKAENATSLKKKLLTAKEFAAQAGLDLLTVQRAVESDRGQLRKARVGRKLDANHPAAQAWVKARGRTLKTVKRAKKEVTIDDVKHLTLRALCDQYHGESQFVDWLKALNALETLRERRIKNERSEAALVGKKALADAVNNYLDLVGARLQKMVPEATDAARSSEETCTLEEAERVLCEAVAVELSGAKQEAIAQAQDADGQAHGGAWIAEKLAAVTSEHLVLSPSQWAEQRWLPRSVSEASGYYSFDRAPYLRELCDSMAPDSGIVEMACKKGVQIGATTAAENVLGFYIGHVSSLPIMWVTADAEMAVQRHQSNIEPMIKGSGLSSRIKANDEGKARNRRTGHTNTKIEWQGGGFLLLRGAQSANKMSQDSIAILIRDEINRWKLVVGKDGDPLALTQGRTAAFEDSRKILDMSTPTIEGACQIDERYRRGDQRKWMWPCLKCKQAQEFRWRTEDKATGEVSGMHWETDGLGHLVPGSVRYLCKFCGHPHRHEDKARMFQGAKWVPTAKPVNSKARSWHMPALMSMFASWEEQVEQWLEAWDVANARPRDSRKLQVFYNNVLAESYALTGERLKVAQLHPHKQQYLCGEIPDAIAKDHAGGPIQLLVCSVDVHDQELPVSIWGWTRGRRGFLIDYWRLKGDTDNAGNAVWEELAQIVEHKRYQTPDGKTYGVALTAIDSGHKATTVYDFVAKYLAGVVAIKGEASQTNTATGRLFHLINTPLGERAFGLNVDAYKERTHLALRGTWDRTGIMPEGHLSFPFDAEDWQLKELTAERRVEELDPVTRQRKGWKWVRPQGAANELWDLAVYAAGALDLLAWSHCRKTLEMDRVSWPEFWAFTSAGAYYTTR